MILLLGFALCFSNGCGAAAGPLPQLVQPLRFEQENRPAELRLVTPSGSYPAGGAGVTVWIRVSNPNPFSLTLRTVIASLAIDGNPAASGNFPLGLPLTAGEASVVPIDLTVSFADVPALATVVRQGGSGGAISYELRGSIAVDAFRMETLMFGPLLLARGQLGSDLE